MEIYTMIYTEEDLKQAYAMGYNEAVDDVNAYIESCDEEYDEDYSAVEAAIMNEAKLSQAEKNDIMERSSRGKDWANNLSRSMKHQYAIERQRNGYPSSRPNEHIKQYGFSQDSLKKRLQDFKKNRNKGKDIWDKANRTSGALNKLSGLEK